MTTPFHLAVSRVFHAQKNKLGPRMAEIGLSSGQPKILYFLVTRGECMQRDIAALCDIEPATVSRLLENMELQGFVQKRISLQNRRAVYVSIADKGRDAYEKWEEICTGVDANSLRGFSAAEKRTFFDYLNRMYRNNTGRSFDGDPRGDESC